MQRHACVHIGRAPYGYIGRGTLRSSKALIRAEALTEGVLEGRGPPAILFETSLHPSRTSPHRLCAAVCAARAARWHGAPPASRAAEGYGAPTVAPSAVMSAAGIRRELLVLCGQPRRRHSTPRSRAAMGWLRYPSGRCTGVSQPAGFGRRAPGSARPIGRSVCVWS